MSKSYLFLINWPIKVTVLLSREGSQVSKPSTGSVAIASDKTWTASRSALWRVRAVSKREKSLGCAIRAS